MSNPRSRLRWQSLVRLLLLGLALPCVYFGGAGAAFLYRHHALNSAQPSIPLPSMAAPVPATRLMVFAPHCDDETLGCAGLMQQTIQAGGAVRTVILTNGDGYRPAVERFARALRVEPADYIRFAEMRQQETLRALSALGLKREDALFFGYPDRGLMALWNDHWEPGSAYLSRYTRCSRSPYALTFDKSSVYCGRDLAADIKEALRAFRPTLVTVTHPADDHGDHAAAAAFVARALEELRTDPAEASWAGAARLSYYLVHRGDWPLPQGMHPETPLIPPVAMSRLDTRWKSLALTTEQTARKVRSIGCYESQTALMGRFLNAFARRTELFGTLAATPLPQVSDGAIRLDATAQDWEALPPAHLDPVRDSVLRDLQGGGDLRALTACRDSRALYLRLDTRQPVSRRMRYILRLRAFGPQGETPDSALTLALRAGDAARSDGVRVMARGRRLEIAIPWETAAQGIPAASVKTLALSAETFLAGVGVDKTGIRFLTL